MRHSSRQVVRANGARMTEAMVKRQAATASEDIVPCAIRMNVEAVEEATMPTAKMRTGGILGSVVFGILIGDSP